MLDTTTGSSPSSARMLHFAHAVLLMSAHYVLQLRDDKPGISAPGMWSLFGGGVVEGEEPQAALLREVEEELSIRLPTCQSLWTVERYSEFLRTVARYSFFEADITEFWGAYRLMEGQAAAAFDFEQLDDLRIPAVMREVLVRHKEAARSRVR